ncbi:hypothetical protein Msil_3087 [Methylocella silvestris BL2]|uniref:Uncharacterized protein n=1 Tax=Methylocella silvestris (strain DSM 15510 / CIP 108128 / LMG 27833 / NCIMB 13906 / BL2) TaxID=395965 RepID=B8EKW8_METSB|nr:hypothetical protein [Methylocella silvestris]ACK51996.1 hypothetical protein Msil_3087 [Methylocella silvestris BL2]
MNTETELMFARRDVLSAAIVAYRRAGASDKSGARDVLAQAVAALMAALDDGAPPADDRQLRVRLATLGSVFVPDADGSLAHVKIADIVTEALQA